LLSKNIKIKMYKIVIFPVVLYGWPVILREECRQGVFVNRVLRRIYGPMRNGIRGGMDVGGRKRPLERPRRRWDDNVRCRLEAAIVGPAA
jgi:hypothetical protein